MKAWIENTQIRDICHGNPSELYHPDIAAFYDTDVPDDAENGDGWVDGLLVKPVVLDIIPPVIEPVVVIPPTISTVDFRNLFSIAEEIAITTSTDAVVKVLWDRFVDPKLNNVDLSLASVDSALDYLTSVDILAAGRKEEILTGKAI